MNTELVKNIGISAGKLAVSVPVSIFVGTAAKTLVPTPEFANKTSEIVYKVGASLTTSAVASAVSDKAFDSILDSVKSFIPKKKEQDSDEESED